MLRLVILFAILKIVVSSYMFALKKSVVYIEKNTILNTEGLKQESKRINLKIT